MLADRYEYGGELGRGAAGRVLRARDARGGADRALKVVPPERYDTLSWELEVLRNLAHPGLARVHELLRVEAPLGAPWHLGAGSGVLVQELVLGVDSARFVSAHGVEDPRRWRHALSLTWQVGRALAALHGRGLLHGDVKPANVRVRCDGAAVLLDVGLAGPPLNDGRVRGTPGFLAPEAWLGQRSVRTDVFALGATLCAWLGEGSDGGSSVADGIAPPPPMAVLPRELPASVQELLGHLCAEDPGERPASIRDALWRIGLVARELGLELGGLGTAEPTHEERALRAGALPLRGREALLEAALARLEQGRPLWLEGPPGAGGGRFAREIAFAFQRRRAAAGKSVPSLLRFESATELRDWAPQGVRIVIAGAELDRDRAEALVRAAKVAGGALWLVVRRVAPQDAEESLSLGPLGPNELDGLLAEAVGVTSLATSLRDAAQRVSGGLPGRLIATIQACLREGREPREPDELLATRRSCGPEALDVLSEDERTLAEALSVAGGALPAGSVAWRSAPERAAALTLRRRGQAAVDASGRLVLRRDLSDAIATSLSSGARRRIAETIDPAGDRDVEALVAYVAGRHGGVARLIARAQVHRNAGRVAEAEALLLRGASTEPALALELAMLRRAAGRYRDALAALAPFEGAEVGVARAEIRRRMGDRAGALEELTRLDPEAAPLTRAWLALGAGDLGPALALASDAPEAVEVRAWAHLHQGDLLRAESLLREGLASCTDPRIVARLQSSLGSVRKAQGESEDAARAYRASLELADRLGERHLAAGVAANLGAAQLDQGELGPGLEACRDAARRLIALGRERDAARALNNLAFAALWIDDLVGAAAHVDQAEGAARRAGDAEARAYVAIARAELQSRQGALGPLRARLEEAHALAPEAARAAIAARAALLLVAAQPTAAVFWSERADPAQFIGALAQQRVAMALGASPSGTLPEPSRWEERVEAALFALERAEAAGEREAARRAAGDARALLDRASRSLPVALRERLRGRPRLQRIWGVLPSATTARSSDTRWRLLAGLAKRLRAERRERRLREDLVDAALALTGAERGCLVGRRESGEVVVRASRGLGASAAISRSVATRALDGGETIATVDAQGDERLRSAASVHALALRSVLCLPLRDTGLALYVDDRLRPAAFDDEDRALLGELAELGALAIQAARTLRAERIAVRRLERVRRQLRDTVEAQRAELRSLRGEARELVAVSPVMRETVDLVRRVAVSAAPVLLYGESGVGKGRLARFLHESSDRSELPFVAESCAAIPETLLESVLFGHERGAFTGASRRRVGLFEAADGGTLFLDEVGEMSAAMQAKLLRVVQLGELRRVGAQKVRRVDVRIVSATHRDLRADVETGRFREDLYYRLAVVRVEVPPLRTRPEDVPALAERFLKAHATRDVRITAAALAALSQHTWPGNVRQLESEIQRALVLADEVVDVEHLAIATAADPLDLKGQVGALERRLIRAALARTGGNQTQAAKQLGVSRYGLQKMIKRLEIG